MDFEIQITLMQNQILFQDFYPSETELLLKKILLGLQKKQNSVTLFCARLVCS